MLFFETNIYSFLTLDYFSKMLLLEFLSSSFLEEIVCFNLIISISLVSNMVCNSIHSFIIVLAWYLCSCIFYKLALTNSFLVLLSLVKVDCNSTLRSWFSDSFFSILSYIVSIMFCLNLFSFFNWSIIISFSNLTSLENWLLFLKRIWFSFSNSFYLCLNNTNSLRLILAYSIFLLFPNNYLSTIF